MMIEIDPSILGLFLPAGILDWFEVIKGEKNELGIHLVFTEKNIPPLKDEDRGIQVVSKGFYDITIIDFPIRGERATLTFRRRRWQIAGQKELLKRDIKLCFPGTQLEAEFAHFLKEDGGRTTGLTGFYRRVSAPPDQRI